jgi:hypothetical protein
MGLLFRSFMGFRCTYKAFGVILWYFKVDQMNQGGHFPKFVLRGSIFSAPYSVRCALLKRDALVPSTPKLLHPVTPVYEKLHFLSCFN